MASAMTSDVETGTASSNDFLEKDDHRAPNDLERATSHPMEGPANGEIPNYGKLKWLSICFALYSAAFLYGLDNTIVADIQAPVIAEFGDVSKLAWLGIGFPLGSIATILPIGKAFGIFDVKWLYVVSLVMFQAGSALCGGAPNMNALIVGRVWAGAGGAGMYLGVLNILSYTTTIQQRPLYIALCGFVWGIGSIIGPVIGGGFTESSVGWRWAFWINLLLFAVCSPVYIFVLDSIQPDPHTPFMKKLTHLDWVGTALYSGMYVCFVMAFTFGGSQWAWDSGRVIALIVMFAVLLIAFAIQQTFAIFTTTEKRLFPVDFLKRKTFILLYVAMSAGCAALFVPVYYIPLYFNFVHGDDAIDAAVRLLPFMAVAIFFVMLNGALMPKYGYYFPWYMVSGVFLVIGGALMFSLLEATTPNANVYGYTVLIAVGAGVSQQAAYSIAQAKVPMNRIADAVGFINSAQIGSIVIALTISGAVFQNVGYKNVSEAVEGLGFTPEMIKGALTGAKSAVFASIDEETRTKIVVAIVKTMSSLYAVVFVSGAVTLIASVLMKREKIFMEASGGA